MKLMDYRELKPHGVPGFPVEFYHLTPEHHQYVMPVHWHLEFELIRVLEGAFCYTFGGHSGWAEAGQMALLDSGMLHAGAPEPGCVYQCLVFDLGALAAGGSAPLADFAGHRLAPQLFLPAGHAALRRCVDGLFDAMAEMAPGHPLVVQGLVYQLFGLLWGAGLYDEAAPEGRGGEKRMRQLKDVLALIDAQSAAPLTLEQMAAAAGMTPKYFCRFFRQMTGRTPVDYLNHHRIERACRRLEADGPPVTELAYECGFSDLSYFIRVFKRYKGVTPRRYLRGLEQAGL